VRSYQGLKVVETSQKGRGSITDLAGTARKGKKRRMPKIQRKGKKRINQRRGSRKKTGIKGL